MLNSMLVHYDAFSAQIAKLMRKYVTNLDSPILECFFFVVYMNLWAHSYMLYLTVW